MTKEITKAYILQEMQDKFKLRDLVPDKFTFSEEVIPIYDVEAHLLTHKSLMKEATITGTGAFLLFTCDDTQRLTFSRYDVIFMGVSTCTVAGIYTKRKSHTTTVYLDLKAGQNASYHVSLPVPVVLNPGDELYVNIDGYTSGQDIRIYIDYMREILR